MSEQAAVPLIIYRSISAATGIEVLTSKLAAALSNQALKEFVASPRLFQQPSENPYDVIGCVIDTIDNSVVGQTAPAQYAEVVGSISPVAPSTMPEETMAAFIATWPERAQQLSAVVSANLVEKGYKRQRAFATIEAASGKWGRSVFVSGTDVLDVLIADF